MCNVAEQPLPTQTTPWEESAQCQLIGVLAIQGGYAHRIGKEILARAKVGHQTYGTYLGVGNPGRDGDRDLLEELLDGMVYAYERYLATAEPRYWRTVLRLISAIRDLHGLDDR
jgi:hypothetical protein